MKKGDKPIKRGIFNVNQTNDSYLKSLPEKFKHEMHEFKMEDFLEQLTPRNHVKKENIKNFVKKQKEKMQKLDKKAEAAAWAFWESEMDVKNFETKQDKDFVTDFQMWLLGKGRVEDHQKTPWYKKRCYDPECEYYLSTMLDAKYGFLRELNILLIKGKMNALKGINEFYMYFKYIVRGEWDKIEAADFMHDWNRLMMKVDYLKPRQHGLLDAGKLRPDGQEEDKEPIIPIDEIDDGFLKVVAQKGTREWKRPMDIEDTSQLNYEEMVNQKKLDDEKAALEKKAKEELAAKQQAEEAQILADKEIMKAYEQKVNELSQIPEVEMEDSELIAAQMNDEQAIEEAAVLGLPIKEPTDRMETEEEEEGKKTKITNEPEKKTEKISNPQAELLVEQRKTNELLSKLLELYGEKKKKKTEVESKPPPPNIEDEPKSQGIKRVRENDDQVEEEDMQRQASRKVGDHEEEPQPQPPPQPQAQPDDEEMSPTPQKPQKTLEEEEDEYEDQRRQKKSELEKLYGDDRAEIKAKLKEWEEEQENQKGRKRGTLRKAGDRDSDKKKKKKKREQ